MAKKAVINRNQKRIAQVAKYAEKRAKLKKMAVNIHVSEEDRWNAQQQLQQLPRDASPSRVRNRCSITGRGRGVYKKFRLARMKLREHAMLGDIPGLVKASW